MIDFLPRDLILQGFAVADKRFHADAFDYQ